MVIAGKSRGQTGTVTRAFPATNQVLIDGVNIVKRHRRATAQSKTGQIIEMPVPLHISNVMFVDPKSGKPTRIKISRDEDGKRGRVAVKSGEQLK